jgi:DNA-binding transcriptional MerR regulator
VHVCRYCTVSSSPFSNTQIYINEISSSQGYRLYRIKDVEMDFILVMKLLEKLCGVMTYTLRRFQIEFLPRPETL